MKYKSMNENTIRKMFQSNETALLQKAVTSMIGTIANTADSLLSSFSIEKFFSNKNFSDLSTFVKDILKQVEDIGNKASGANINSAMLQKTISEFMKDLKINTKTTSESVNKIVSDIETKSRNDNEQIQNLQNIFNPLIEMKDAFSESWKTTKEDFRNITDKIINTGVNAWKVSDDIIDNTSKVLKLAGNGFMSLGKMAFGSVETFQKEFSNITENIGNNYIKPLKDKILDINTYNIDLNKHPFLSKILGKGSDYSEEQKKDEEKQRSEKQNRLAESQLGWLQGSLMPWLKKFGEEQRLASDGFLMTFFPMLANLINASPLLLKILGFGKLLLGIGGAIFGAVKFVEGIGKAVDVLGHEIDFTSLHGWLEALNLGIGNIVSAITGIDLKTVYNWLNRFDKTLANAYRRYLAPIFNSLWKSIKETVISAYNHIFQPIIDKVNLFLADFSEKFPAIYDGLNEIKEFILTGLVPALGDIFKGIFDGLKGAFKSTVSVIQGGEETDWDDFLSTLMSPIETISTGVTEMMKYIATFYQMLTKSGSITDFFNSEKWKETFEEVSSSSFFSGNEFADEIKKLEKSIFEQSELLGQASEKRKQYEQMNLKTFGIGGAEYTELAEKGEIPNIWNRVLEQMKDRNDRERLQEILSKEDLTASITPQQAYARDKQIMEEFGRKRLSAYDAEFESIKSDIEKKRKQIEQYNLLNERNRFVEAQKRRGISEDRAYDAWNKMRKRIDTAIEPLKNSNNIESQNEMSIANQAEIRAEETKPVQSTINANGSGNTINNYNNNVTTSNVQSGLNEQQMMESAKNTGM